MSNNATTPDARIVREIARECAADYLGDACDIAAHVIGYFGPGAPDDLHPWICAVRADLSAAVAAWPDEQQPAEVTGGEQVQDGEDGPALARLLATLERHAARGSIGGEYLDADIRSILNGRRIWKTAAENAGAERDQLRDERDALVVLSEADTWAVARCQQAKAGPDAVPAMLALDARFADRIAALETTPAVVIGAGSPETSALTHCPTCSAPEWLDDGRRGWNPVDVECEVCAGTYDDQDDTEDVPCCWCHCDGCDGAARHRCNVCGCRNPVQR